MQQKGKMNIVISVIICIVVIAILVLISITSKKKEAPIDSHMGDASELATQTNNMEQDTTQPTTAPTTTQIQGVKITITTPGTGAVAKSGDTVAMNYTGTLVDGTAFDSNVDPKFKHVEPFVFTLGGGQVIKGWDIGVAGMKVGEKRTLSIEPDFAYGPNGIPGVIPGNAVLNFDVELVAIKS